MINPLIYLSDAWPSKGPLDIGYFERSLSDMTSATFLQMWRDAIPYLLTHRAQLSSEVRDLIDKPLYLMDRETDTNVFIRERKLRRDNGREVNHFMTVATEFIENPSIVAVFGSYLGWMYLVSTTDDEYMRFDHGMLTYPNVWETQLKNLFYTLWVNS